MRAEEGVVPARLPHHVLGLADVARRGGHPHRAALDDPVPPDDRAEAGVDDRVRLVVVDDVGDVPRDPDAVGHLADEVVRAGVVGWWATGRAVRRWCVHAYVRGWVTALGRRVRRAYVSSTGPLRYAFAVRRLIATGAMPAAAVGQPRCRAGPCRCGGAERHVRGADGVAAWRAEVDVRSAVREAPGLVVSWFSCRPDPAVAPSMNASARETKPLWPVPDACREVARRRVRGAAPPPAGVTYV